MENKLVTSQLFVVERGSELHLRPSFLDRDFITFATQYFTCLRLGRNTCLDFCGFSNGLFVC